MNIDWGVILGITAIVFVFVGLFVEYRSGRFVPRKKLVYEVLSKSQILHKDQSSRFTQDLEMRWKRVRVESLVVVPLVIHCVGRKEILPEDFHQPLNIVFDGVLLDAFATETEPDNLINNVELIKPHVDALMGGSGGHITSLKIKPLLLNHKNSITITMLYSKFKSLTIKSHIAGVTIEERRDRSDARKYYMYYTIGFAVAAFMIFIAGVISASGDVFFKQLSAWILVGGVLIGIGSFIIRFITEH